MHNYLMIENKITSNKELVEEILESAGNLGEAMTLAEFEEWLDKPVRRRESSGPQL